MFKRPFDIFATAIALLVLAGCGQSNKQATPETKQTDFPGQITAGGLTSGEVMAKNGTLKAKPDAMGSPVPVTTKASAESAVPTPQQQPQGGGNPAAAQANPEGTPGIPEGSGGTVGGTQLGGTTAPAAATELPPKSSGGSTGAGGDSAASEKAAKEAEAKAKAEQEKKQLAASMDSVAQRWKETAAARGWETESQDSSGETSGTSSMGQTETSAIGLPTVLRSEKLGTAPASEDVKNPAQKPQEPSN